MHQHRPFFSLITVCFNSRNTIERTILSVLGQSNTDYEYVIIDGKSTDGTLDVIKKYEPAFHGRLKWISEPDGGIYDAFNKGCRQASGEILWLVNSDDYIVEGALDIVKTYLASYASCEYPIISGSMVFHYGNGDSSISAMSRQEAEYRYSIGDIGINHPATLIPGYIYEKIGYYDDNYRIMADMDWFRRAYEAQCPFLWIDDVLTNMTEGGISTKLNFIVLARDRWHYSKKFYKGGVKCLLAFCRWMTIHLKGHLKFILVKNGLWKKR